MPQRPATHEGSSWVAIFCVGAVVEFGATPYSVTAFVTYTVVDAGAIACRSELVSVSPDNATPGIKVVGNGGSGDDTDGDVLVADVAAMVDGVPPAATIIALMVASSEASSCCSDCSCVRNEC